MKKAVLALLTLLSLGFMIETPESIRERKRSERAWQQEVNRSVDFRTLHRVLVREIDARKVVAGIDITVARTGKKWNPAGMAYRCGDWWFSMADPKSERFQLRWTYEESKREDGTAIMRSIIFMCIRESRKVITVEDAKSEEYEVVLLLP